MFPYVRNNLKMRLSENSMNVSVIIPVYNAEKYICRVIESLKNQTLRAIEIILVDDGSTDGSPNVCDIFASQDARVRVIHAINNGVSTARNLGIMIAKGDYLMFCDADDVPDISIAEKLFNKATLEDADCVLCGFIKKKGTREEIAPINDNTSIYDKKKILHDLIMPMLVWGYAPEGKTVANVYGSVWRCLYRRSVLVNNGIRFYPSIKLGEDMLFNEQLLFSCNRVAFVSESLYVYNENEFSATHTNKSMMWEQYIELWKEAHSILIQNNVTENDICWHNYQLSRYATSAIVEGLCSQYIDGERQRIRDILSNKDLQHALNALPKDLRYREKIQTVMMKPSFAWLLWKYYQVVS